MRLVRTPSLLAAIAAIACCVSAGAAPRDDKEKALVGYVRSGEPAAIALLEQIVNVNSGTMNFVGVRDRDGG
jgi:hypothetical protein